MQSYLKIYSKETFMKTNRQDYPLLLKRKHIKDIGISEGFYYKLIKSGQLPTVKLNNRTYINRDALFDLLENTTMSATEQ